MRKTLAMKYYGGKLRLLPHLLPLLPPHHTYLEVFGGGGALLLNKPAARVEIYNDLNSDMVNLFSVLRDGALAPRLLDALRLSPYARVEFELCRSAYRLVSDPVERARRTYVALVQARNARLGSTWSTGMVVNSATTFKNRVRQLPAIVERLLNVHIENKDFREIIPAYDSPETLIFLDPPYVSGTRVFKNAYFHEMSDADHRNLLDLLLACKSMIILLGYASPLYDEALGGWDRSVVGVPSSATGLRRVGGGPATRQRKTEVIWRNPAAVEGLAASAALVGPAADIVIPPTGQALLSGAIQGEHHDTLI